MKGFVLAATFAALALGSLDAQQSNQHPTKEIVQPPVLSKHELFSEDHTAVIVAVESVFSAYVYYNDSHNGPAIASLFTPNAIIHFVWNNKGTLVPEFGINPQPTPEGVNGEGCVLTGRKDFETYYGYNRDIDDKPLAIPGKSHHVTTSKMVKVSDDEKTAMMTASWLSVSTGSDGAVKIGGTGTYRIFFEKTSDGWEISEFYGIGDHPSSTTNCDLHGPLPRPKK